MQKLRAKCLILLFSLCFAPAIAADLIVTRHFSGHWDQPEQESQGLILQIVDHVDDGKKAVVYWFTYGDDMAPTWYLGVGDVIDDHIDLALYSAFGAGFMQADLPGTVDVDEIGTMVLNFRNCNHGTASFDTPEDALGSGEFPIKRLSSIYRSRCSGGISDDEPGGGPPTKLEVRLVAVPADGPGSGKAQFWLRGNRMDFHVNVEGLADGPYAMNVCGVEEGVFDVIGGEGSIKFRSPQSPARENLVFDPRDCEIEVLSGAQVVLDSDGKFLGAKETGPSEPSEPNEFIEVEFESTGVIEGARGHAEWESGDDGEEFSVDVRDVPVGLYPVLVGGMLVGEVDVTLQGGSGQTRGKLKFDDSGKPDRPPFDFNVFGEMVEVTDGTDVILFAAFPDP